MPFYVFDLDGTLADIQHRRHFITNGNRDYDSFFAACVDDLPNEPVIAALAAHLNAGHKVEIWSGRSDIVRKETEEWLLRYGIDHALLTHMRSAGDHQPDVDLKMSWLHALHPDERPTAVYDDRGRVVRAWRDNGVPCFAVTEDWEKPETIPPIYEQLLTVMVGPSCGGKSSWAEANGYPDMIVSSDNLRWWYCKNQGDQSRNDDVFTALHKLAKARLDCGLPVIIDATNLRRRDRLACVALAPAGTTVRYVVCNRPMADKIRAAGWRADVRVKGDVPLLEAHEQRFQSQLKDILRGDGLPNVEVVDYRLDEDARPMAIHNPKPFSTETTALA